MHIRGIFFIFCEQGIDAFWALQDGRFIRPPTPEWPHESWSYDGLIQLKDNDYIRVFNEDGTVYWRGRIAFRNGQPIYTDGWWWRLLDAAYLSKEQWKEIFLHERRGELIRED